ncbi:MAG TPA: ferrous iron transport protein A [Candidatus Blautia intestinigallinarum]|nr:ferrous iron transport protein A [Candidatus Blautia intestinigallinarum]
MRLSQLSPGQSGIILALSKNLNIQRRLLDLGFVQGTRIKCLFRSPLGDPTAYLIRGTVIALRREDASKILITPKKASPSHQEQYS